MDNQQKAKKNSPNTRAEIEAVVVARAWQDEDFRRELLSNPKAAISRELDREISESTSIQVLEESNDTYYIVIPKKPELEGELSEDQLEAIAGGWPFHDGPDSDWAPDSVTIGFPCSASGTWS